MLKLNKFYIDIFLFKYDLELEPNRAGRVLVGMCMNSHASDDVTKLITNGDYHYLQLRIIVQTADQNMEILTYMSLSHAGPNPSRC